jgi:lipopolysaccharide export system protein LptA
MPRHASALVVALFLTAAALPQGAAAQEAATPAEPPAPAEPAAAAQPPAPAQPARVSTGLVTIESDQQRADQLTGVITATGNVRIVYPDERVVATARQAQYFSKENRVVLSGDVDIVQEGGNLIRAERVVYLVDGERLIAIPPTGQQVFSRVRIQQTPPASPAATPAAAPAPAPAAQP